MLIDEGRQVELYSVEPDSDADLDIRLATIDTEDGARVEGLLWFKAGTRPKSAVLYMHPANNVMQNFTTRSLAREGLAAFKVSTRYAGDDSTLIFENCLLDIAGAIRWLRREGIEHVALYAHSGGASMGAYYQSQAEHPDVTATPAGDPPDLTTADLPPVDAMIISNPHRGRHINSTRALDPSVVNEDDPIAADPDLDMYNPKNGPPYAAEWRERYRAAQVARNHRITVWCQQKLAELDAIGHPVVRDLPFVFYRTVANPAFLDRAIDPSDRPVGESTWGKPYILNYYAPVAHSGRRSTLRSWLSQFGLETSNCDLMRHIERVTVPTFFIQGTADTDISVVQEAYARSPYPGKELVYVQRATHLFKGQPELLKEFMGTVAGWLRGQGF
jgi:pimeloyl-ACP methyl ester carboxylesterase